jgi:tungstate transport system substrate-binding protein
MSFFGGAVTSTLKSAFLGNWEKVVRRIFMGKGMMYAAVICLGVLTAWPAVTKADQRAAPRVDSLRQPHVEGSSRTIRALVIGGMTMTDLWPQIVERFEKKTGYRVVLVDTGPRPGLDRAFRQGKADLLTMHSGDITTDLVVDGYGTNMRPWARNDLVIYGPPSDPAHIKGLKDGAEAMKKIAEAKAPFLDSFDNGGREMAHKLWKKAGLKPTGPWIVRDDSTSSEEIAHFASEKGAYLIMGRMPYLFEKGDFGNLIIMVEADPDMRRPYIVMEANPPRFPEANHQGARALSDFLLSRETQTFMKSFRAEEFGGIPLFYPVWPVGN